MKRKICVVTGSRAEYGLLKPLLSEIKKSKDFKLQLVVTGSHLSPDYGYTIDKIINDGFNIDSKIEILLSSDSSIGVCKSIGLANISFAETFLRLQPDLVVILGDRYEAFAAATSAFISRIPIAHISGGDLTLGAIDDDFRHSITKFSSIHFTTTKLYRKRVIQLGEQPNSVFYTGNIALDNINTLNLLSKKQLEKELGFKIKKYTAIITFHSETLANYPIDKQVQNLLEAIRCTKINAIFTKANADNEGRVINKTISKFVKSNKEKYLFVDNLGQLKYLSSLNYIDLMIGNSSSGLTEAPSFHLPVVNIGYRQKGRVKGINVIDTGYETKDIKKNILLAISESFGKSISHSNNPYNPPNNKRVSRTILNIIRSIDLLNLSTSKEFYDIDFEVQ